MSKDNNTMKHTQKKKKTNFTVLLQTIDDSNYKLSLQDFIFSHANAIS